MLRRLIPHRNIIPKLVIAQRVIDKMLKAAQAYVDEETGEAMIGLVVPPEIETAPPTIYVLDTLPPDIGDPSAETVREQFAFIQGDMIHHELFLWLYDNWNIARKERLKSDALDAKKWDIPLIHPGDWHKQPGYMIAPSGGDLASALEQLDDPDESKGFLLVPIVTMDHPTTTEPGADVNYVLVPCDDETTMMRVDFWYIHKKVRVFQPINPVVVPNDELPELVPYPWHLENADRAEAEFAQLRGDQLFYSIVSWDTDNQPPMEVCIAVARMGLKDIFILVTPYDYPANAPTVYHAPYIAMGDDQDIYDVFEQWWSQAEQVELPADWVWDSDKYLIDLVRAAENALGIEPPEPEDPVDKEVLSAEEETPTIAEDKVE